MAYNKKVLSEAVANLNKAKAPAKKKDIIVDPRGQWAHPGQPTRIPGNNITMQGVPYPVYGVDNTGFAQMMYPGQDYQFQGDYVDEYPLVQAKKGGEKKYSRSITATNRLFKKNPLIQKKKNKRKKTFDPNAKYYQDGGQNVNCDEDSRCFETDEEQRLLDLEADLRRKAVDTGGAAFELTGETGDARKAFKKLGMKKSLGERLPGVENPYTCMYYAGMPYCINEGVDPRHFESNDKFIKAVNEGKVPFTQLAETYDPNFEQNMNIPTGSIVSLEKPTGKKHAMLAFKHPETGEPIFFQSSGEENDWRIHNNAYYKPTPGHPARIYQYTPFAKERERLAEQARINPTYYNVDRLPTLPAKEISTEQTGGDISIPELTKAQEGMTTGQCPPGYAPLPNGECAPVEKTADFQEAVVYGDPKKAKEQTSLMNQLRQMKGAYQDWRENAGLTQRQLRNEGASSIEGLKRQIADYKKELEEEKKAYDKAGKALNVLKKHRPDEWKNAKLNDVLSGQGIEALRSLYSEGKVSKESFMNFYDSFGKDFDPNVIEGKGRGQAYSAKEAEQEWMENVPEFVNMVNKVAIGAPLLGAAGALAPAAVSLVEAGATSPLVSKLMANPIVQGVNKWGQRAFLADTLINEVPNTLNSIDQAIAGEKSWGDASLDVLSTAVDLVFSKGAIDELAKAGKKAFEPVGKILDTPFSAYVPKKYLPDIYFDAQNNPLKRTLLNTSTADIFKTASIAGGAMSLPYLLPKLTETRSIIEDPNASRREKWDALKDFGHEAGITIASLSPVTSITDKLFLTRPAQMALFSENFGRVASGDPTAIPSLVGNINRISSPSYRQQKGGSINSYETELSKKEIKELEKKGYKIEYLD